ncbi:hypothetical protein OFC47_27865, partial [Escherichia coli]|nr:hypothetical protein [Escherichia coli]
SLIGDNLLGAVFLGELKLLKMVGEHVSATEVESVVAIGCSGSEGQDLGGCTMLALCNTNCNF